MNSTTSVDELNIFKPIIGYNTTSQQLVIESNELYKIEVYTIQGKLIYINGFKNERNISIPKTNGEIIVRLTNQSGKQMIKRLIILK